MLAPDANDVDTAAVRLTPDRYEHHVSAAAATKMGGIHRMTPTDRPIVVRFADSQGNKRQRGY